MRKLIAMSLITLAAACSSNTGPDGPVISVRLRDDSGAPAGRNQIVVTQSDGSKLTVSTGNDGKANIRLASPGDCVVSVIERNGFVASDALTRRVSVTANTTTTLEFTLYRKGTSTFDPPDPGSL